MTLYMVTRFLEFEFNYNPIQNPITISFFKMWNGLA